MKNMYTCAARSRVRSEMARRRARAHPVSALQTDLAMQLHGVGLGLSRRAFRHNDA